MKVDKNIFFRKINEDVYVKDLKRQQEYLLNETAGDILEFMKNNEDTELDDIVEHLKNIYNTEINDDEIWEFLQQLAELNIVELQEADIEPDTADRITEKIKDMYSQERKIYSASLELTYRCNEKCIHCYIDDDLSENKDELTLSDYKNIINQLSEMGCISLLLTGGEVCLREDFIEILKYSVNKGLLVNIYTNGIALTDEQFDEICKLPINSISFSLYGATAETHDKITKVQGSFEKTLKRMMMFKCAGKTTYFKSIALEQNKHERKEMLELSKRLGIEMAMSYFVLPSHCGVEPDNLRLNNVEEYQKGLELFSHYYPAKKKIKPKRNLDDIVCYSGQNMISIDPYGNVMPCISLRIILGNIKDTSIKDIWEKSDKLKKIQNLTFRDMECNPESCSNKDFCEVCMGSLYNEENGKFLKREEYCMIAEAEKRMYE